MLTPTRNILNTRMSDIVTVVRIKVLNTHKIIGVTCTLERPVLECPTENYVAHTEVVVRYQE